MRKKKRTPRICGNIWKQQKENKKIKSKKIRSKKDQPENPIHDGRIENTFCYFPCVHINSFYFEINIIGPSWILQDPGRDTFISFISNHSFFY